MRSSFFEDCSLRTHLNPITAAYKVDHFTFSWAGCIRCAFFYLLFLAVQAQQPKKFAICALRAALCSPRYK